MANSTISRNVFVIIPCYNHGKHLGDVIAGVRGQLSDCDIVVVDDGSDDDSALVAASHGCHVIRHGENQGKGAALWSGIQWGLEQGKEWFLFLDADGQHPANSIPDFLEAAAKEKADFIMGNRLGDVTDMPPHRRLSNRLTSGYLSKKSGKSIPDSQCGFRLIHRRCLEGFQPTTRHYDTETEILLYAASKGARFTSVTIPTIYRGQSSSIRNIRDTLRFLRIIRRC